MIDRRYEPKLKSTDRAIQVMPLKGFIKDSQWRISLASAIDIFDFFHSQFSNFLIPN